MREIKFRAWHKKDGIMRMVTAIDFVQSPPQVAIGNQGLDSRDWWWECNTLLMQYTGLKDKNGKEIYEGDVVKIPDRVLHIVGFRRGMFCWENLRPDIPIVENLEEHECEVIGNVYENPGLLEKGK